jgi:hypothetical protein
MARLRDQLDRIELNLAEHMRRTEALEALHDELHERIKPIEQHVSMWAGAGKAVTYLLTILGIVAAIFKALSH